ncbi:MAG: PKD domain-containing protein, partial [Actinomycetota bacterium]|nr:PKD domain-containing protein [Actinomycetota bacterium]
MRRLVCLLGLLVVALGVVAPRAGAANQTVTVSDDVFDPGRVAIKPGESVTWNSTPVSAGEAHNVFFVDGSFTSPGAPQVAPWTATRTFMTAGKYPYYCQAHGPAMSGVVYVNALGELPPLISLTASPLTATVGQAVTYTASASSANGIATYEWDLDGNGSFETNTGTTPTVTHSYTSSASVTVHVRVTDNHALSDESSVAVQVNAPAPTTTPTTTPTPTPTPPPGGHPIGPGSAPPSVTGYAIANAVFRVGRAITPMTGKAAKAVATGTKFTYKLSEAAVTKIALLQLAPGRKKGRACVKLTAKATAGKTCIRAIPEGTLTRT